MHKTYHHCMYLFQAIAGQYFRILLYWKTNQTNDIAAKPMAPTGNDHIVINATSLATLCMRAGLYLLIVYYAQGRGFDPPEFKALVLVLSPVTAVYAFAFIRFALRYGYTTGKARLKPVSVGFHLAFALLANLAQIVLVVANAYYKQAVPFEPLLWVLLAFEIAHAGYIGFFLARLVEVRER